MESGGRSPALTNFNPRSQGGATASEGMITADIVKFQSTLPRGSDRRQLQTFGRICKFQSTLPRGSDLTGLKATHQAGRFQSTLPRGSDVKVIAVELNKIEFQSTLPRGSDFLPIKNAIFWLEFQSTLPRGSDVSSEDSKRTNKEFQSTLPRGSDAFATSSKYSQSYFNPRSQGGATQLPLGLTGNFLISIHAPKGERPTDSDVTLNAYFISIHAPKGERPVSPTKSASFKNFNPRSQGGATFTGCLMTLRLLISIHAPKGERPQIQKIFPFYIKTISSIRKKRIHCITFSLIVIFSKNFLP